MKYKYIEFNEVDTNKKTKHWFINNHVSHQMIGEVYWYAPWRQYCFYPGTEMVFNVTCLSDIQHFVNYQMELRKKKA